MKSVPQIDYLLFEVCVELGECYAAMGEFDAATQNFNEAAAQNGWSPRPHEGLARVALAQERWQEAQGWVAQALNLEPESDAALSLLGTVLLKTGKRDAAWEEFQRALERNPGNREALQGLARCADNPDKLKEATERLKAHLARQVADFPVLLSLAEVLATQGHLDEAQEALGKILLFQPDHPEALALRAKLLEPLD